MAAFCAECFGHPGIRNRLKSLVATASCSVHEGQPAYEVETIVEILDPVFRAYHYPKDEGGGDDLTYSLAEFLQVDEDVAVPLAEILIETEGHDEPFYEYDRAYEYHPDIAVSDHRWEWYYFREDILHRRRFFAPRAREMLDNWFKDAHLLRDKEGNTPVYRLEQGTTILRGRIAENQERATFYLRNPREEIGPPPNKLARAGRMHPSGITAFYGALDIDTCVAELRPGTGRSLVIAEFALLRPIYVFDLSFFSRDGEVSDIFEPDHIVRTQQWRFMNSFMEDISQPVLPEDETLNYIPTQAVAEYLSNYSFKIQDSPRRVSALIYPSAQNSQGKNIVFLGEAAEIKDPKERPEDAPLVGPGPALEYVEKSAKGYGVQIDYHAYELKWLARDDGIPF
jgi:hypothetical protein